MGYSKGVYQRADRIMSERRLKAQRIADEKKYMFYMAHPRANEIENELAHTFTDIARAMMIGDNNRIKQIKDDNLKLQNELEQIYKNSGMEQQGLKPEYTCKKCEDRGSIDGRVCDCYRLLLKQLACDDLNRRSPLSLSDFSSFSLSYYPQEHLKKMKNIFNYCKDYAESFTPLSDSIIMMGKTGLGKTHLALAIANEVIKNGMGVIYISAPDLVTALEEYQFNRDSAGEEITPQILSDCDLLIIDDLGTEFVTNFSRGAIYNVFNSRISKGRPTIMSTNLMLAQLEKNYTDRFVSRVTGYCRRLNFEGNDIRIQKKMNKIM